MSRLTYDWPLDMGGSPMPGDVLATVRRRDGRPTGTLYLIVRARVVQRREPVWDEVRLALEVGRVTSIPPATRVESLQWYSR